MTPHLETVDVGSLTNDLRNNARSIMDIWMQKAHRRQEFGRTEMDDIIEVSYCLATLLLELERHAKPGLRVVGGRP